MDGDPELLGFIREELEAVDPHASLDRLTLDVDLGDLDLDSVALLSLVAALEDRHGTRVSEESLPGVRTVRDLVRLTEGSP